MKRAITLLLVLALALTQPLTVRAEDSFGMGVTEGNSYWNETMEIGCALDESWYFYTREEILEANGITAEMLDNSLAEIVQEGGTMIDMLAVNPETGATVNVVFERLSLVNALTMDENDYIRQSQPLLKEGLEQLGLAELEMETRSTAFLGEERQSLFITGSYDGTPIFETQVVLKSGRNVTAVTVFSLSEDEIGETLAAFFSSLD